MALKRTPEKWLMSLRDAVMANVLASMLVLVVGGIAGAFLKPLIFGQEYEKRIAALEARLSQPTVINNIYTGENRATNWTGDVTEIRTLTQAEYDAISTKRETTLYIIVDER